MKTLLVTGGAGFIGSNFVLNRLAKNNTKVIVLDKLTYAGNLENLKEVENNPLYTFIHGDIANQTLVRQILNTYQPEAILNFAAESHVDRSIHGPEDFIQTNVMGTLHLLNETKAYWKNLCQEKKDQFRFLHVSTDEVYGSLSPEDPPFCEISPYAPNSPYAASKASSDHLVRAYYQTYRLPTLTSNCSNNYGPYQFPEKLIPLTITNALAGQAIPIYGNGLNTRDWLFVQDHCRAIDQILERGKIGETYNIGGHNEKTNLEVVKNICAILEELCPPSSAMPYTSLMAFIKDRPGHDLRYAIDATKIERELGWKPKETFEVGLRKTVMWYLNHRSWIDSVKSGAYREWIEKNYAQR